jgi:hypothetical protein
MEQEDRKGGRETGSDPLLPFFRPSCFSLSSPAGRLRVLAAVFLSGGAVACAGGAGEGGHDVVPESRDVRVGPGAGADGGAAGYEYIARRPLAVVALAEARGVDEAVARAAIERLADALDTCATTEGSKGTLVNGAARVVAQIAPDGTVAQTGLRVDPGAGVLQNAVLCLVAPVKMLAFPPTDAGARGIAIEAIWGHVGAR